MEFNGEAPSKVLGHQFVGTIQSMEDYYGGINCLRCATIWDL